MSFKPTAKQFLEISERLACHANTLSLGNPLPSEGLYQKVMAFYRDPTSQPQKHVQAVVEIYKDLLAASKLYTVSETSLHLPALSVFVQTPIATLIKARELHEHLEIVFTCLNNNQSPGNFFEFVYTYLPKASLDCSKVCVMISQVLYESPINLEK